jgi:hypothetical protein
LKTNNCDIELQILIMTKKKFFLLVFTTFLISLFYFQGINIYRELPYKLRQSLKKTLNWSISYNKYKVFYKNYYDFPKTALIDLDFKKIRLVNVKNALKGGRKAVGYIEIYKDKVIAASGYGDFVYMDTKNISKKSNQNIIETNLSEIIKDDLFFLKKIPSLRTDISIDDLLIIEDDLFVSFTKEVKENCYNSSIIKTKINLDFLEFENFFTFEECVFFNMEIDNNPKQGFNKTFSGQQAGGRMAFFKYEGENKILFATGNFTKHSASQDDSSKFGKVLLLDLNNPEPFIFAKGLRNPQGLLVINNSIIASSHGPYGGDEINNIKINKNYGWPIASYGTRYGYQQNERIKYKKNHKLNGFTEPIYSFVPSVGLSQLINVEKEFNIKWENNILLTSLKGESIFRLTMDDKYSRIISKERIIINERIRDIVYDKINRSFYLLLEDSGSLGIIKNK